MKALKLLGFALLIAACGKAPMAINSSVATTYVPLFGIGSGQAEKDFMARPQVMALSYNYTAPVLQNYGDEEMDQDTNPYMLYVLQDNTNQKKLISLNCSNDPTVNAANASIPGYKVTTTIVTIDDGYGCDFYIERTE
jgi:hypothetical protein